MAGTENYHWPVLLEEVLRGVEGNKEGWYVDATLGDGGHALGMLKLRCKVLGVDADPQAIERARLRFERIGYPEHLYKLVRGNFRDLKELVYKSEIGGEKIQGVLFDLGVSNEEFFDPKRGFSFSKIGPLDMRMDPSLAVKARDLINGLNKGELYELFSKLGEEKFAKPIADAVVLTRQIKPIDTTGELADLVEDVYLKNRVKRSKIHPATKVFQALRIAVNDELNALKEALPQALDLMGEGGRVKVISFHSLEDRIVKVMFKEWVKKGLGRIITKRPMIPTGTEVNENPRSRSAKLRIFEKNL